jgi:hypothetical protein
MEAASALTPPQELFRELTDLGSLVFSMLTGPQAVVRRWPAWYMAYVQIDGLCREVSRATGYLSRGFIEAGGRVSSGRIEGANACLARVDGHCRTMADLLARIERHGLVTYGRPTLKDVVSTHFSPESAWYQAFQQQYCSGRIAPDGRVLERTVLPVDPYPASGAADGAKSNLPERQTFELVSDQSRTLLGRTARKVQTDLNQVYAAMGDFLVDRSPSTSELLHPGMN